MKPRNNPFRTERLEAIEFRPEWLGTSWTAILNQWEQYGRRGCVVGRHGTGKTTFLDSAAPRLEARGYQVERIRIRQQPARCVFPRLDSINNNTILLIDSAGYHWRNAREINRLRRISSGYIETRHWRGFRPVILRTKSDQSMLARLVKELNPTRDWSAKHLDTLYRKRRGNLRLALLDCFDTVGLL